MRKNLRILAQIIASAVVLCLLFVLASLLIMQTAWFREKVRQGIVAAVQDASGGRVELGSFSYSWPTLTATFSDFVVHGTEPSQSPPLFKAAKIDVRLAILSVLERRVAVSSITVERPNIYILVHDDGSTNIPSSEMRPLSADETVRELLNVKLRHLELRHGTFTTDLQKIPLDLRCDDTAALITYNRRGSYYLAKLSSRNLLVEQSKERALEMTVSAQLRLARNRLSIDSADLVSGDSRLHASGALHDFARPVLDMRLAADVDASEAARSAGFSELRGGRVLLDANLHRDSVNLYRLTGKLTGRKVAIRSLAYDLPDCDVSAQITAVPKRLELTAIKFAVPWAELTGNATLVNTERLSLVGRINSVNVVSAEKFIFGQTLPWNGIASGSLNMNGLVGHTLRNFAVQTTLDVVPSASGPPLSAHVEAEYHQAGQTLDLTNSRVDLAHTHLAASGRFDRQLHVTADTTNFEDFRPLLQITDPQRVGSGLTLVKLLPNGSAHFDGDLTGPLKNPAVSGALAVSRFSAAGENWAGLQTRIQATSSAVLLSAMTVTGAIGAASGNAQLKLTNWSRNPDSEIALQMAFRNVSLPRVAAVANLHTLPLQNGSASGSLNLQGTLQDPRGTLQFAARDLTINGQPIGRASANVQLTSGKLLATNGALVNGPANIKFSGTFDHPPGSWRAGQIAIKADSNTFPLSTIAAARDYEPGWDAETEIHIDAAFNLHNNHIDPTVANGTIALRHVTDNGAVLGDIMLNASTKDQVLYAGFSGDLRQTNIRGNAEVRLVEGSPAKGAIQFDRVSVRNLYSLVNRNAAPPPIDGFLQGAATFEGPLQQPDRLQADIQLNRLEMHEVQSKAPSSAASVMALHNVDPILLNLASGRIVVRRFRVAGTDTNFSLAGSVGLALNPTLNLKAEGALDLKVVQLFQPGMQTTGQSLLDASLTGTLDAPNVGGSLEIRNASLFANGFANGLTGINGLIRFNRDRASIDRLIAQTGGGSVTVGGFVAFSSNGPWLYRLDATAENVRLRYANSISVTANSELRLSGTTKRSILSGTATVSRVVFTPNADLGTLLATSLAPSSTANEEGNFLTGLQLDVQIESAPDLQVTTELSRDVQAEIDLRLRGTPEHPMLLGDIVANQGDIKIFGGKYSINRGEIRFVNAARIEPVLDLDLQTVARGITVDVTIAGTLGKLNINYRSDPPLQPRDIIALLTVGRVPDTASVSPNVQNTTDTSAMQYGANTVVGQAISPVSNRISKLFGITNIKIDPLVQGITNAPQARLTLEQQVSREITVTYVTNLSETSEQIFRVEWAFSPQYSLVVLRDDNGEFGIDVQYKKRFK